MSCCFFNMKAQLNKFKYYSKTFFFFNPICSLNEFFSTYNLFLWYSNEKCRLREVRTPLWSPSVCFFLQKIENPLLKKNGNYECNIALRSSLPTRSKESWGWKKVAFTLQHFPSRLPLSLACLVITAITMCRHLKNNTLDWRFFLACEMWKSFNK